MQQLIKFENHQAGRLGRNGKVPDQIIGEKDNYQLGIANFRSDQVQDALRHFNACRSAGIRHEGLHYWFAVTLSALGRRQEAEQELDALLKQRPDSVPSMVLRDQFHRARRAGRRLYMCRE